MNEVDEDDSGAIEFPEFLSIIKNGRNADKGGNEIESSNGAIFKFFDKLTKGEYAEEKDQTKK